MLGEKHCNLKVEILGDKEKMLEFLTCCKRFLEERDKPDYFNCMCSFKEFAAIVAIDIPCCNGDCGRKHLITLNHLNLFCSNILNRKCKVFF